MKLSRFEFDMLLDCLKGSLRTFDNARIFFYTHKNRVSLLEILTKKMDEEGDVEVGSSKK